MSEISEPRPQTLFVLSPARLDGRRARILLGPDAAFPLARELRERGAAIGAVFSFLSGLYFRGKLAYADAFAHTTNAADGVLVIAPGLGLVEAGRRVTPDDLRAIAEVGVSPGEPRFTEPLESDALRLLAGLSEGDAVVLLGSIATGKYVDVLERTLARYLRFPESFVGRGDMSRGGLMLRCVLERRELTYVPITGAIRHGTRPPRLEPI